MKFIDFLNTIYTEAAEAATFCDEQGGIDAIDTHEFMDKLDETDAETIIAILCAEKHLNLANIVDKSIKAMEKLSFAELLDQINDLKDKED